MKIIKISKSWYTEEVAQNPNTSPDILKKILERGNDEKVSWNAAKNPNCPTDVLRMVLERGNNDLVSWNAAKNPNCPPDAKIKWMRETGQIEKEDPNKHIIEYYNNENDNEVDEDLEKLRSLISSNKFNLKKFTIKV